MARTTGAAFRATGSLGVSNFVVERAGSPRCGTVARVRYPSDLNDEQWKLVERLLEDPSKRGPKHGSDLRTVTDGML